MTAEYYWTLPTRGDGRSGPGPRGNRGDWTAGDHPLVPSIRDVRPGRYDYFDYLGQIARAAAVAGLSGVFVPFDGQGEDSWIVSATLARQFPTLEFVTEFSPAFATPVYATKMSATFQRFSGGRLGWKLAIDGGQADGAAFGDHVEGAARFDRAREFLDIATGIWGADGFTYRGRYFEVEEGGLRDPLTRHRRPPVTLSGVSAEALSLSATHADIHLWPSSLPESWEQHKVELDRLVAQAGRRLRHGAQLAVVARETEDEAWDEVRRQWRHGALGDWNTFDELVLAPDVWSGFRLIGHDTPTGVVGSYEQVAAHLQRASAAGIDVFYLGASPGLEEAYRFGEHLAPLLVAERVAQAV
jgi:alkanesulfonate monooxygenase